ncbi:protein kinase domain-containing protein [Promicromonospora panici]|uniref:protein kinase domain-containing protein n=1 Tax=Promicromonospora panici TaxID=2219658 RepID=UPI00101C22EA|nr:protein kinase [Promicromonospora panici]
MSGGDEARPGPGEGVPDGSLFGGCYLLGDLLGVGGTASVFAAEDVGAGLGEAGRPVALKILHPHLSADAASRDAFLAEARAAQELHHPNIAAVHGSGVQEVAGVALAWIALDLVDGGSVGERVDAAGPLPPAEAAAVLDGVLAALVVAHEVRLVHRDVSPANVMLQGVGPDEALRAEHVRLVDFGLADAAGRTAVGQDVLRAGEDVLRAGPGPDGSAVTVVLDAAQVGIARTRAAGSAAARGTRDAATVVGNPQFMSPEQAQGRPVRVAGDVYQAGALLYYLLTGRPPFPRDTDAQVLDAHVSAPPPVPSALVPGARAFDRVVTRAMHKTPVRRFRDAAEMRAALTEATTHRPDPPEPLSAGFSPDQEPTSGRESGTQRTGGLEYLTPAEVEPELVGARRNGVAGAWAVVAGLVVAGLAGWAAIAAPGLPDGGASPSPSASASASPTPTPSRTASPSPSPSASSDPSPSTTPSGTGAPSLSATPTPSETGSAPAVPPSGSERVSVPVLTGTLGEAQDALRDVGLVLGDVTRVDSPEPVDTVLGQRPVATRTVREGTEVDVTVASGRNAVPTVAGMALGAAVAELESAGFEPVLEDPNAPPTLPTSGTTPRAGTVLRLGVSVTVLVGEPEPTPSASPS